MEGGHNLFHASSPLFIPLPIVADRICVKDELSLEGVDAKMGIPR